MYQIYQVNLKPHKQQLKNSSTKMMWQHRASKITRGQVRAFRLKHYLKIYYIFNCTFSNGCRSRNEKVWAKTESDLTAIKVAKQIPIGFGQHWVLPWSHHYATSPGLSADLYDSSALSWSQNSKVQPLICLHMHRQQHDTPDGQERTLQTESQFHHTLWSSTQPLPPLEKHWITNHLSYQVFKVLQTSFFLPCPSCSNPLS